MEKVLKKLLHTEKNLPRLGKLPRCLEDVMGPEIPARNSWEKNVHKNEICKTPLFNELDLEQTFNRLYCDR